MGFMEFMKEEKPVNRFFILRVAVIGAFAGSLLAVAFMFISTILR